MSGDAPLKLYAACAFGIEAILKRELQALGYDAKVEQPGRVAFAGSWLDVCRTNLWLRTADRVLLHVHSFPASDFEALFETIKAFDYSRYIPAEAKFPVLAKTRLSQLTSLPAIQRSAKRAVVESMRHFHQCQSLPESGAMYKVEVALLNDVATVTIDTTGPSLHKRGYRKLIGPAPIKETLAAAMVNLSVWDERRVLADPFCGTGTIAIEAALQGLKIAPGIDRFFACSDWPQIEHQNWIDAQVEAKDSIRRDVKLEILASDQDEESISMARYHAKLAGVTKHIDFRPALFEDFSCDRMYGCIVTNPPYGQRLQEHQALRGLYEQVPGVLQKLPTWSLYLITSMPEFEKIVQKRATRRRKLFNGRLECTYYQYLGPRPPKGFFEENQHADQHQRADQDQGPDQNLGQAHDRNQPPQEPAPPIFQGTQDKDLQQAQLFHNRLAKRARHLRRWPKRRGITCFRIYERDIPEIPLVVDRYEDSIHITEYERPHDRDLARHQAWLDLMANTAAKTLEVPRKRVHVKVRNKRHSGQQYEKVADRKRMQIVREGGLQFWVNLTDYVDTGLFLDHRLTREMVRQQAAGKSVLNLFSYTGSFTVYAASGGAASTTTVDLSKNYLSWAKQNLELNQLVGPQHEFLAQDCAAYVDSIVRQGTRKFDLVIVDPPTFSNSKRTESDWSVQQHHAKLLQQVGQALAPQGVIYFSTNFRKFKLATDQLSPHFSIEDISKQTVPEDFRNRKIHRCWRLRLLSE